MPRPPLPRSTPKPQKPAPIATALSATKISPARLAAFQVLERIKASDEHSDDLLHGRLLKGFSQQDKNLTNALVLGVLRWQIALDARLRPLLQRPNMKMPSAVETALRLGAFQLLQMDRIPAHAALSESVELVRVAGQPQAAGMVNAVLRGLTRQAPIRKPLVETNAALAERLGHPTWLFSRWVNVYGRGTAVEICDSDQQEPSKPSLFAGALVDDFVDALWIDDGSRLVAEMAAATIVEPTRIWDCCAAPGGKTRLLAARHPEAEILATDVSPRRLKAMSERFDSHSRIRTLAADATALPAAEGDFDLILCDAPCSGTGTLGRNPEIRHRLRKEDFVRQAARQESLLTAAASRLKPGGRLVYSTCSLEPEENEEVVQAVLAAGAPLRQLSVQPAIATLNERGILQTDISATVRDGCLRTLPGANFAGDGFFAAIFERF